MTNIKAPIFIAAPRSRSTALFSLAARAVEQKYGLLPLGQNTEFFNEWSWRNFVQDDVTGHSNRAEYFPINKQGGLSHHYVYPPILNNRAERNNHKIQVLRHEKSQGRNYNVKIMAHNLFYRDEKKYRTSEDIIDFFSDRQFVITRRKDIRGLALSSLVATHTKLWHKRNSNKDAYLNLYKNPITINPELCTVIRPDLEALMRMDSLEDTLSQRKYDYKVLYYEDLTTVDDMKKALDDVFQTDKWRATITDEFIENSMPQNINLDYEKAIANYNKISTRVDTLIYDIFE